MDRPDPELRAFVHRAMVAAVPDRATEARVLERIVAGIASGSPAAVDGEEDSHLEDLAGEGAAAGGGASSVATSFGLKALAIVGVLGGVAIGVVALRDRDVPPPQRADEASPTTPTRLDAQPPTTPAAPAVVPPTPTPTPAPTHERKLPAAVPSVEPAHEPSADDFLEEVRLVGAAQKALERGEAARALELAREHAKDHPRGQLVLEREVIESIAGCRLGDNAAADRFLADHPRTTMADKVRTQCVQKSGGP